MFSPPVAKSAGFFCLYRLFDQAIGLDEFGIAPAKGLESTVSALDLQIGSRGALDLTYNRAWPARATCTLMTVLPGSLFKFSARYCKVLPAQNY